MGEIREMTPEQFREFCSENSRNKGPVSNYVGVKIDRLLIIDTLPYKLRVRCDCGREENKDTYYLRNKAINFCCSKCGKLPRKKREDFFHLIGKRFGPLEVIDVLDFVPVVNKKGSIDNIIRLNTRCSLCAKEVVYLVNELKPKRHCSCEKPVSIGDTFGDLTVVEGFKHLKGLRHWKCLCICGRFEWLDSYTLSYGYRTSCSTCKQYAKIPLDLCGLKVGRLTVISPVAGRLTRKEGLRKMYCLCDCGKEVIRLKYSLLTKNLHSSCGCLTQQEVNLTKTPWKYRIDKNGGASLLPSYTKFARKLFPMDKVRKDTEHKYLLEVSCTYCGKWFMPSGKEVSNRIGSLQILGDGNRFYCSKECKRLCPIFGQRSSPKDTSLQTYVREVQPELRQLVFERDGYECQRCGEQRYLNCHHYTGVVQNPIESADIDNCVTLCVSCHKKAHQELGCRYHDLRCA